MQGAPKKKSKRLFSSGNVPEEQCEGEVKGTCPPCKGEWCSWVYNRLFHQFLCCSGTGRQPSTATTHADIIATDWSSALALQSVQTSLKNLGARSQILWGQAQWSARTSRAKVKKSGGEITCWDIAGVWDKWTEWSKCSSNCALGQYEGEKTRQRNLKNDPLHEPDVQILPCDGSCPPGE